ncbi:MAG: iron-sulfur cluster-binding domain-containing protein [Bacteroidota bacterium]
MYKNSIIKRLKVTQIIEETKEAKTFVLTPLDDWKPIYKPGQFITLVFNTEYGEKRRSYSMSSTPEADTTLQITVKKLDNGEFSRFLITRVKEGDILESSGISGQFVLPENKEYLKQFFFIAAGSGITPCFSLMKTLLKTTSHKVVLIYSNKSREDAVFYEQLKQLESLYPERLRIKFLFSNENGIYNTRLSSWLLNHFIEDYLEVANNEAMFYVCGPFDYMLTVQITLLSRFPASHVIKENYSSLPRKVIPKPPDTDQHKATITINNKSYSIATQYPQSILDSAIEHNIQLPYSCKAGRCASCVATCSKGKVWMAYNEVLTDDEVAAGRILVCQSFAVDGDVEIIY